MLRKCKFEKCDVEFETTDNRKVFCSIVCKRKNNYYRNQAARLAQKKEYREKNKERIRKEKKLAYEKNKDEILAKREIYRNKNRDEINRKKNEIYEEFIEKWYSGLICNNCQATENIHYHHIDPETKLFEVSTAQHKSDIEIEEEIKKCVCLCTSCHTTLHNLIRYHPDCIISGTSMYETIQKMLIRTF